MFLYQKQTNVNFILSIGTHILNGTDTINRDVQQHEEMFFYNSSCSHQKTVRLEQLAYRIGKQMVKILDGIENRTLLDFCFFLWFILQGGHTMDRPVKLVSPSWIWKCIKKGHLVPENKFAL